MRHGRRVRAGMCVFLLAVCAGIGMGQEKEPNGITRKDPTAAGMRGMDTVFRFVNLRDMDLARAVRVLAANSNINIVVGPGVQGKVACDLTDVTARDALTSLLQGNGYELTEVGSVLIVVKEGTAKKPAEGAIKQKVIRKSFTIPYTGLEPVMIAEGALQSSSAAGLTAATSSATRSTDLIIHDMLSSAGKMVYYDSKHLVIVEDYESNVNAIGEFVKDLWAVPTQVFIDSKLVEVSLDSGDSLGLNWQAVVAPSTVGKIATLDSAGLLTTSPGVLPQPNLALPGTPFAFGISNQTMDVVLNALVERQRQDLQSSPRMLVMNHQKATFVAGKEIPYLTSVTVTGGLPINTFAFKEAAVRLDVTPHVSEDGLVFMDVHPTVRAQIGTVSAGVQGAPPEPVLSVREVSTRVAVKDGMTLIIGGMMQRTVVKQRQGVPFLSNIPVLGLLFQSKADSDSKTDLLFLVSPRVLTPELMQNMLEANKVMTTDLPPHRDELPASNPK